MSVAFASATSQATGKDERTIRRAAARGEKLGDDLKEIEATSRHNEAEMFSLYTGDNRCIVSNGQAGERASVSAHPGRSIKTRSNVTTRASAAAEAATGAPRHRPA